MRRAVLLVLLLALAGCSGGASAGSSDDPATQLAQLDGSTDVAAYTSALDDWQAKCQQDRETVAGYVDTTFEDEQRNGGPDTSRLVVMQNLAASVPGDAAPTDCASITAAYLVMVEPG